MAEAVGYDQAGEERLRSYARRLVRRHRRTIEPVASALIKRGYLTSKQIDDLVWPRKTMTGFVAYEDFRRRFGIQGTRKAVMMRARLGEFPRAWVFNNRLFGQRPMSRPG